MRQICYLRDLLCEQPEALAHAQPGLGTLQQYLREAVHVWALGLGLPHQETRVALGIGQLLRREVFRLRRAPARWLATSEVGEHDQQVPTLLGAAENQLPATPPLTHLCPQATCLLGFFGSDLVPSNVLDVLVGSAQPPQKHRRALTY